MKNILQITLRKIKIVLFCCITIACYISCSKYDKIRYGSIGTIGGFEIRDICVLSDTSFVVVGYNEFNEGKLAHYSLFADKKSIITTTNYPIHGVNKSSSGLWACGDSMTILFSNTEGKSWSKWKALDYFWEHDMSSLQKIYSHNSSPMFVLGKKNMLNGNLYVTNTNVSPQLRPTYPLKSIQLQKGINDFVVIDSSQIYAACYGSIIHVSLLGDSIRYEDIGGYNFTSICLSGTSTLACTTFEGEIFIKDIHSKTWKKTLTSNTPLRHIAADNNGNLIALGDSRDIYISNDHGSTWRIERFAHAKDVTCLVYSNNVFYLGKTNGEIQTISTSQID